MSQPYIGFSHRAELRSAKTLDDLDREVELITSTCGVSPRQKPWESFYLLAMRVRPISAQASDHITFAQERFEQLERTCLGK